MSRDYPQEIIDARKLLRAEMKSLKSKYPSSKISIQNPAKLVIDGRIHKDMFPQWREYMNRDRLKTSIPADVSSVEGDDDPLEQNTLPMETSSALSGPSLVTSGEGSDCPFGISGYTSSSPTEPQNDIPKAPSLFHSIRTSEKTHTAGKPPSGPPDTRDTVDLWPAVQANELRTDLPSK